MHGDPRSEVRQSFRFWNVLNASLPALLRKVLGVVLLAAGAAKVFAFSDFVDSLRVLLEIPHQVALPAAALLVVIECVVGAGLMFICRTRVTAAAASLLFGTFAVVLTAARSVGKAAPCGCFGILPVRLSNEAEIFLDIVLLNLSFLLWLLSGDSGSERDGSLWRRIAPLGALSILLALFSAAITAGGRGEEASPLVRLAEAEAEPFRAMATRSRLMLVADIRDFGCLPCFEDFLAICDEIRNANAAIDVQRVVVLLRQHAGEGEASPEALHSWARETGIPFGVVVVPESVMIGAGATRSAAILIDAGGREIFRRDLPIGRSGRDEVVRLLSTGSRSGKGER